MADVAFVHALTGTAMLVPEERVEEYKAAGHVPADALQEPQEEPRKRKKKE